MTREDRLALLGDEVRGGAWADLGAGAGAFTFALAERIGPEGRVYSVDRDQRALRQLRDQLDRTKPDAGGAWPAVQTLAADYTAPLPLHDLDGILLANTLHYQRDPCAVVSRLCRMVRPGGRILVVEYDVERSNPWVPYPLPSRSFNAFAECVGLIRPRLIAVRPSAYHGRAYSAVAEVREAPAP